MDDQVSMVYWWPRVEGADVPMPRTSFVSLPGDWAAHFLDGVLAPEEYSVVLRQVQAAAERCLYPCFLRTDIASAKHNFDQTCFVADRAAIGQHIAQLLDDTIAVTDRFPDALVVREYLPLESYFTAFWGHLPIARERRYFVEDGRVLCHHPYWPEAAIRYPSLPEGEWQKALRVMNRETLSEVRELTEYAERLSVRLPGAWSVDFARRIFKGPAFRREPRWVFIDAAPGGVSWHPEHVLALARKP